jgi:hypothetical protein
VKTYGLRDIESLLKSYFVDKMTAAEAAEVNNFAPSTARQYIRMEKSKRIYTAQVQREHVLPQTLDDLQLGDNLNYVSTSN